MKKETFCKIALALLVLATGVFILADILYEKYWKCSKVKTTSGQIIVPDRTDGKILDTQQDVGKSETESSTSIPSKNENVDNNNVGVTEPWTQEEAAEFGCRLPTMEEKEDFVDCPSLGIFPLKDDCKLFRKCYSIGSRPEFLCCPKSLWLNLTLRTCVAERDEKCQNISDGNDKLDEESTTNGSGRNLMESSISPL